MKNIPDPLQTKIKSFPFKPGVYQMKDAMGNIIYIGKSKTLQTRVKSYFATRSQWEKVAKMVCHIQDIDIIITDTHLEARLLECELIKKIKPIYNVQFKNDQKYKYLKIEDTHKGKVLSVVNERRDGSYLGPYRNKKILENVLRFFENTYPISKIEGNYIFVYSTLPCSVEQQTFEQNKACIIEIFTQEEYMERFIKSLENKMMLASNKLHFEKATTYRDAITDIQYIYYTNAKLKNFRAQKILLGEVLEEGYKIFYISQGYVVFKNKYKILNETCIKRFLEKAQVIENTISWVSGEKSSLDFESIIYSELTDQDLKGAIVLRENCVDQDIQVFIEQLLQKKEKSTLLGASR